MAVMYAVGVKDKPIAPGTCIRCGSVIGTGKRFCDDCKRFIALEKCRDARDNGELSQDTSE